MVRLVEDLILRAGNGPLCRGIDGSGGRRLPTQRLSTATVATYMCRTRSFIRASCIPCKRASHNVVMTAVAGRLVSLPSQRRWLLAAALLQIVPAPLAALDVHSWAELVLFIIMPIGFGCLPLLLSLVLPRGVAVVCWICAFLLLGYSFLLITILGAFYLPSAIVMVIGSRRSLARAPTRR